MSSETVRWEKCVKKNNNNDRAQMKCNGLPDEN